MRTLQAPIVAEKPRIGDQIPAYILEHELPIWSAKGRYGILQTRKFHRVGEMITVAHCVAVDGYGVRENGAYFEMFEPSK